MPRVERDLLGSIRISEEAYYGMDIVLGKGFLSGEMIDEIMSPLKMAGLETAGRGIPNKPGVTERCGGSASEC